MAVYVTLPGRNGGVRGGRGRSGGFNRESKHNDFPAHENGYAESCRRSEEGDGVRRVGYQGSRHGDLGEFEHPRRNFERHSGTGHGNEFKRDEAGRGNWGTTEDEIPLVTEESTTVVEKSLAVEKEGGEKWSKGKQKEKVNNMVLFDQATYDKLLTEAPKFKLITPSILSDRLRSMRRMSPCNSSQAKRATTMRSSSNWEQRRTTAQLRKNRRNLKKFEIILSFLH